MEKPVSHSKDEVLSIATKEVLDKFEIEYERVSQLGFLLFDYPLEIF